MDHQSLVCSQLYGVREELFVVLMSLLTLLILIISFIVWRQHRTGIG
jgi:hypothetical protein